MEESIFVRVRTIVLASVVMSGLAGIAEAGDRVPADTLTVAATPSLRAAFQEIVPLFEREYGVPIRVMYGSSQTLRRQIEKGAPIDVFLSAAEEIEKLQEKGLTLNGGLQTYAQTSLVLVMSATSHAMQVSLQDVLLNRGARVAVGDLETSALGVVTTRALKKLDPDYKNHSRLLHAQHNEEVVNLVHTGEADVGIVYRVDAIHNSRQVRLIDETLGGAFTPVLFGQAVVWTCRDEVRQVAEDFFDFIASARIQKLLLKHGFDPVPSTKKTKNR